MAIVVSINNFKGDVSKTSTTIGIAYVLSQKLNYKTLVLDLDPQQADATETLLLTYNTDGKEDLYYALKEKNQLNQQY